MYNQKDEKPALLKFNNNSSFQKHLQLQTTVIER